MQNTTNVQTQNAHILTGKDVVAHMKEDLCARVSVLQNANITPTLALVRMGKNPDDLSYERTAIKRAEGIGIKTVQYELDEFALQVQLEKTILEINRDPNIHGCLMFRPLPTHIDEQRVCNLLNPEKDIDGISEKSLAGVFSGSKVGFPPCTAKACLRMLDFYNIPIEGKHAVVIGRSLVIGKPVAMMLLERNASVTICHSKSENLEKICKTADIVICATGRARAFNEAYFAKEQTVLDVGINFDTHGNLCGDVDFDSVANVVGALTPVPGGLGSVTTSITMEHTICAAEKLLSKD